MPGRALRALVASAALVLAECGAQETGSSPVDVVATTPVVGDLARAVAGRRADVTQVVQPNTDAHEYEPRPDDVVAAARAELLLQSGEGLDRWAKEVREQSGTDAPLVDLSRGLPVRRSGEAEGDEASRYDPHWWHDPRNVVAAVGELRDALTAADPAGEQTYARNAAAYVAQVRTIEAGVARCFAALPAAARKLVPTTTPSATSPAATA